MSTKSLMADKRVKEVTLNDAGKAATLTLADGWSYEGSSGPFNLTNVEHGHKIVKAASGPKGVAAREPRSAQPKPQREGEAAPATNSPPPSLPRGPVAPIFVYRTELVCGSVHTITGWLKTSRPMTRKQLFQETINQLERHQREGLAYEVASYPWTKSHEQRAGKELTAGSPWAGENLASGSNEGIIE